jgi:aryl-alcohol dehydrogenase-like predicted oxidoreductase
MCEIVCVQNQYNLAHQEDDDLIDNFSRDGNAYVPFFSLGGFSPLQSSILSDVATRLHFTPSSLRRPGRSVVDPMSSLSPALRLCFTAA